MTGRLHFACMVFFLGLMGFLPVACGTRYKALQHTAQAQWSRRDLITDSAVFSSRHITDALGRRVVQVQWEHTVFDTQAPPDPHTGLRPVKSRSGSVVSIEQTDSARHVQVTDSSRVSVVQQHGHGRLSGSTQQCSGRKQSTWLRQLAGVLLAAAVLMVAVAYAKFRRRNE